MKRARASLPKTWQTYPDIPIQGFHGPNKVRCTLQSEQSYELWSKNYKSKIYREGLQHSQEWQRALRLCNIRPFRAVSPLLDKNGKVITSISEYVNASKDHLSKATGCIWSKGIARSLVHLPDKDKDTLVKMMIDQIKMINLNKSCGCDGVHPS